MELATLKRLATRPLRFLRHLQTSGDVSNLPLQKIVLSPPNDDDLAPFGIKKYQLHVPWESYGITVIAGGRCAVCPVIETEGTPDPIRVLLCWDLSGLNGNAAVVSSTVPIVLQIKTELRGSTQCSISLNEAHDAFTVFLWEYSNPS